MKKCPKCGANIQENARFCLYCMTPFEEKTAIENEKTTNNRWLIILAAVLVLVIILLSVFMLNKNDGDSKNKSPENSTSQTVTEGTSQPQDDDGQNGTASTPQEGDESSEPPQNNTSSDNNSSDDSDTSSTPPAITSELEYRDAKQGDDFSVGTNLENCIVITGVKNPSADGNYIIPSQIDNKKVIAISSLAFCDENIASGVKSVVVPSSVKTIQNDAFANCYNLSDIYFMGDSIYTDPNAFPETSKRNSTLTIHCKATCNDRNFRYYKNLAADFGAEYKEWNG